MRPPSSSIGLPFNRPNRCGGYSAATGQGHIMVRTVWLATICLAVLSALAVAKALKTPADAIVAEGPTDQMTVGTGLAQDTLSKADRLEITFVRQEILPQSTVQPTKPFVPAVSSTTLPIETKIISRHWHDPNTTTSPPAKPKQAKQTGTNKSGGQAADRSKPTEPMKPCSRPGAFGDFLRSLNLSPACDS
jgi:hypothetical protein